MGIITFDGLGCWDCNRTRCMTTDNYARFGTEGGTHPAMARFFLGPGRIYRLTYDLENSGGPPNAWEASVNTVDGPPFSVVLESLNNSMPFKSRTRIFTIIFPANTTVMQLTFTERQVGHQLSRGSFVPSLQLDQLRMQSSWSMLSHACYALHIQPEGLVQLHCGFNHA
jgi:hypothetical protein